MLAQDYAPLTDSVRTRLLSWANKTLSFAGRLVLIKSVISSIANFWCSVFRLPTRCLVEIESMCNAFLWSGSPNQHHKAKVSWEQVCIPKAEGGLGLRKLGDTSRVFAYSLIWRILTSRGSLWVKWVHHYLIRKHSFWELKQTTLGSWVWHKLLKLRESIFSFIKGNIGDGRTLYFWYDKWLQDDSLLSIMGPNGPSSLGVRRDALVVDAIAGNRWCLRSRVGRFREITEKINQFPIPRPNAESDSYVWRHSNTEYKRFFSAKSTWDQIRIRQPKVPWARIIWFPQCIQRCSFITWLAFRDRLSTGERMRVWGGVQACVLCGERSETRDHLFFACPYTFTLWSQVSVSLLGRRLTPDWQDTINRLIKGSFAKVDFILIRLALQVSIDRIWRERNDRRHGNPRQSILQLASQVDRVVRNRLHSLSYQHDPAIQNIMERWIQGRN